MLRASSSGSSLVALALLCSCATVPTGPSVLVLPGTGKSFDVFRVDDGECRGYAYTQVNGATPDKAGATTGVGSAVVGTAMGAAAGALINGGSGAAVGAGAGLLLGALVGTGLSQESAYASQQRYDNGYVQCMYFKGNRVPIYGPFESPSPQQASATPPAAPSPR